MAVDYEAACREGDLAALLTAAFLLKEGARILILPDPDGGGLPEPDFILPVVRGYPAALLANFMDISPLKEPFFSWQSGTEVQTWEVASPSEDISGSEIAASSLRPELCQELEKIWQLIDGCMIQNLDMPATSIGGFWHMFRLLVQSELLRDSRRHTLSSWLDVNGIGLEEQRKWFSLVPQLSLYRFQQLPLLAFAYGVQSLRKPAALVEIKALKDNLLNYLLDNGARRVSENWSPVFDGKWYIGVGYDNIVACRSTVYIADSNPDRLRCEIPLVNQRHDFKRQLRLDDLGYRHVCKRGARDVSHSDKVALYHLQCSTSDELSEAEFFSPVSLTNPENRDGENYLRHVWEPVNDAENACKIGDTWGWHPRLPAMMGGGFLPLTGSFCRFYRVGWHNLPGFGLGGLVYSARQAAFSVLRNELR